MTRSAKPDFQITHHDMGRQTFTSYIILLDNYDNKLRDSNACKFKQAYNIW